VTGPTPIDTGGETYIDPAQATDPLKGLLSGGDIHHGQHLTNTRGGYRAGEAQFHLAGAHLHLQDGPAGQGELGRGGGARKEGIGLEGIQPDIAPGRGRDPVGNCLSRPGLGQGQQGGSDASGAKEVDAEDAQAGGSTGQARLDFQQRAGLGHLRALGQQRIKAVIKATLGSDDLQIRLATDQAHTAPEFIQCRGMDELHRQPQRHSQGDG
jgi:hypothetical protein